MLEFFIWSGCDLLRFGFVSIRNKNINSDMFLVLVGILELIFLNKSFEGIISRF